MCPSDCCSCLNYFVDNFINHNLMKDRDGYWRFLIELVAFVVGIYTFDSSNPSIDQTRYISKANSIVWFIGALGLLFWAFLLMMCMTKENLMMDIAEYLSRENWSFDKRKRAMSILQKNLLAWMLLIDGILFISLSYTKTQDYQVRIRRAGIALNVIWLEIVFLTNVIFYPVDDRRGFVRVLWNVIRGSMDLPPYLYGGLLFFSWHVDSNSFGSRELVRWTILLVMASTLAGKIFKFWLYCIELCRDKEYRRRDQDRANEEQGRPQHNTNYEDKFRLIVKYNSFICLFEIPYYAFVTYAFFNNFKTWYFVMGWIAKQIPVTIFLVLSIYTGEYRIDHL